VMTKGVQVSGGFAYFMARNYKYSPSISVINHIRFIKHGINCECNKRNCS
jgi:hypothetical protein